MTDDKPLINIDLGNMSETGTALVNRVSGAFGVLYEPLRITRRARAEAKAAEIAAKSQIEISDLQRRALQRFISEEAKKQQNIESITAQAANQLGDDAKPEKMDDDWIAHFFEKCRIVSDTEMQSLWAKILAGEATEPNTFSKRTLDLVSTLNKYDASLFTTLCGFKWQAREDLVEPFIHNLTDEVYTSRGLYYGKLAHLESIGLITYSTDPTVEWQLLDQTQILSYHGLDVCITFLDRGKIVLRVGHVHFTAAGFELSEICGSVPYPDFFDYIVSSWVEAGLCPYSPLPSPH